MARVVRGNLSRREIWVVFFKKSQLGLYVAVNDECSLVWKILISTFYWYIHLSILDKAAILNNWLDFFFSFFQKLKI